MSIEKLLNQKDLNVEYFLAMTRWALYQLSRYSVMNKSEMSDSRRAAVERDIEHCKKDYERYAPIFLDNPNYKPGVKN